VPTRYPDDLQKLLKEYTKAKTGRVIEQGKGVLKWLADEKAAADSDIDIVLISPDFKDKNLFARLEMVKEAEIATIRKFMIPLDVIMMTPEEFEGGSSLVSAYAKERKVLFAA
jgi:hypothetical protein